MPEEINTFGWLWLLACLVLSENLTAAHEQSVEVSSFSNNSFLWIFRVLRPLLFFAPFYHPATVSNLYCEFLGHVDLFGFLGVLSKYCYKWPPVSQPEVRSTAYLNKKLQKHGYLYMGITKLLHVLFLRYLVFTFQTVEFAVSRCSNNRQHRLSCAVVLITLNIDCHVQASDYRASKPFASTELNPQSVVAMDQIATPDETAHASAPSVHKLFDAKLGHHSVMDGTLASTSQSSNIKTQLIRSSSLSRSISVNLEKRSPESDPESPQSHVSHPKFAEPMFSNSSTFCTSLFSSSSTTEPCRQMGTLPFLPHPPKCEQQVSAGHSSSSSLLLSGDTGLDVAEQSDDLNDLLNLSGDASDGSFHGENNALAFDEQMEFQFLSEQLEIAITDNEKNPHLDVS